MLGLVPKIISLILTKQSDSTMIEMKEKKVNSTNNIFYCFLLDFIFNPLFVFTLPFLNYPQVKEKGLNYR